MEIVDTPNELGNTNIVFKIIMQIMIFIVLIGYSYTEFTEDNSIKLLIIRVLLSLFTSVVIAHFAWIIADIIRKWIMPNVLVTSGAMDALKQKIFWLYGPQFTTSWLSSAIFFAIFNLLLTQNINKPSVVIEPSQITNSTIIPLPSQQTTTNQAIENSPTIKNEVVPPNLSTDQSSINQVINVPKPTEEKLSIEELEKKANYSGDDPVIRARLGLPPKN
jgi:hypothetical protein